ncbi:MAG: hypothetical protein IJ025_03990 [Clostridia bacterium]|nr:hypothetical protein [Clostridia bacterium]
MFGNITDIHSHTLWDIDDGAEDFNESVEMCMRAEDAGTKTLFLTPHLMYWEQAEDLYDEREEKTDALCECLEDNDSNITLVKGFEILCDDEIFDIRFFKPYTLNNSRYILIEFNFFKTTLADVVSWCDYLSSFGLVPIIAHPERYGFVMDNPSCVEQLSEKGVLFQINAGSPTGMFGEGEAYVACEMLNCGYVDFIGSDAHDLRVRNTDILSCVEMYPDGLNLDLLKKAACENPEYILKDGLYVPQRLDHIAEM